LSTKVVVAAADEDTALAVDVVPGQAGDAPLFVPMLDRTLERVAVDEAVGDKGFDGDELRAECIERDVNPNIPLRSNRDPERWAWDPEATGSGTGWSGCSARPSNSGGWRPGTRSSR
jgi:hypothetical protein